MNNIFTLIFEKSASGEMSGTGLLNRSLVYAIAGFVLGISAPVGWVLTRLLFFYDSSQTLWYQVFWAFHP